MHTLLKSLHLKSGSFNALSSREYKIAVTKRFLSVWVVFDVLPNCLIYPTMSLRDPGWECPHRLIILNIPKRKLFCIWEWSRQYVLALFRRPEHHYFLELLWQWLFQGHESSLLSSTVSTSPNFPFFHSQIFPNTPQACFPMTFRQYLGIRHLKSIYNWNSISNCSI